MITLSRQHFVKAISSLAADSWDFLPPSVTDIGVDAVNGYVANGVVSALSMFDSDLSADIADRYLVTAWVFVVADIVVATTYSTRVDSGNDLIEVKKNVVRCLVNILPLPPATASAVMNYNSLFYNAYERAQTAQN